MRTDARALLRLPLPTLALAALLLALCAAIVVVAARGTQAAAILATPARASAPFQVDVAVAAAASDLSAIQSQPLVHSSRAFYAKPAEVAPSAPPKPDYRLAGAMILPGKAPVAVIVNRTSKESRRVKPGDDVDGWRVASVDRRLVVLNHGNERADISAATFDTAAPAAATVASGGLKRVPISRQRVSAVAPGVQALGAQGSSAMGGPAEALNEAPRLYRPPPQ